jgi:TolA-binding protein
MKRRLCGTAAALLLLALALPAAAGNYLLYSPEAVSPEETGAIKEGVLVREIEVHRGDTLSGISRRFSGRSSYFPQILLFNQIKNPNLIYSGATLRVPLPRGDKPAKRTAAAPDAAIPTPAREAIPTPTTTQDVSASDLSPASNDTVDKRPKSGQKTTRQKERLSTTKAGRKLFHRAVKAYRREECSRALALFDRFLSEYPSSPLAADASLYKADCYLKQSIR